MKRYDDVILRLQRSLLAEAVRVAKTEGVTVNELVNVAVAEKLSALRTAHFFLQRASRSQLDRALERLERIGKDNPPVLGDELPSGWRKPITKKRKKQSRSGKADR